MTLPRIAPALALLAALLATGSAAADDGPPRDEIEQRFARADRNGDGRLTPDEVPNRRLFARLDLNGDGVVTLSEGRKALASGAAAPSRNDQPESPPLPPLKRHLNVPYAEREGVAPELLSLDLYAPAAEGKHPVMVMIHGGGWRKGDKGNPSMTRYKVPHFVGAGFVYASINYRLSTTPEVKHPAHIEDVAAALAFLHDHVAEYGGDPDRIFVMGHSAGAHLAALIATDHRRLEAAGKSLSILKGVVCLDTAAYDVPRYVGELDAGPVMQAMYERAFGKTEAEWRDASPRHHVAPGKGIPPLLFFHTGSRLAGATLSKEIVEALGKAGTPALVIHAADRDHAGINSCVGQTGDPYTALIMRFLADPAKAGELAPPRTEEKR